MRIVKKTYFIVEFVLFYMVKLVQANIYIAFDIVTPKMHTMPDFITLPLKIKSDFGLLLFSNLVSMTPGSLTIDINEEKNCIEIHILYNQNKEKVRTEIEAIQNKINYLIN
ncbi:MAG: hypothetical protein C0597_08350 [Marinilabiliales bacterium]|nr:MAG: hypothetical protein C0597_08350 [Marinilabiliales bacterium]